MSKKVVREEKERAIERLRQLGLKPGSRIYTQITKVSRSGMSRWVKLYIVEDGELVPITWLAGKAAGIGADNDGLKIGGCGFSAEHEAVYNLGWTMFRHGFVCAGEGCPSNDHSNGDRSSEPHDHTDGGYAFRQVGM